MIPFQSCIGSAYSSVPVRWIETADAARAQYALDKAAGKPPVEKTVDPDLGKPRSASGDIFDLSPVAKKSLKPDQTDNQINIRDGASLVDRVASAGKERTASDPNGTQGNTEGIAGAGELTAAEKQEVAELKVRDAEVRAHEMAHVIAAGQYVTSGPSYEYKTGPDGRGYAVAGSVGIDTSPVAGNPEATISKMQAIASAAMAPASPSGQDHKVAAQARQVEAKARVELAQKRVEEQAETQQPEEEVAANESLVAFSIVRTADQVAGEDSVMPSLVQTQSKATGFAAGSAYKSQSIATAQSAPQFSAFA